MGKPATTDTREIIVEILLEYGYSLEEIDALLALKVVGVYAKE